MKHLFSFLILIIISFGVFAQTTEQQEMLEHYEDSLIQIRNVMLKAATNEERIAANEMFAKTFFSILSQGVSYSYDFDSIPSIGDLRSPDGTFRMIMWNLPFNDGTHEYYCYVQTSASKKKAEDINTIQLLDKSESITRPEKKVLAHNNWYGALYYEIIPVKDGRKTYYTLLGWDGNDKYTSKKIIDVMYFSGSQIKFGAPIFKLSKGTNKRVIFEYSADAVMSVKYYKKDKRIIYDHLSPMREELTGIRQYYVPDMSFDAFELKKAKWIYTSDVDAKNQEKNLLPYNNPE